MMKMRLAGFHRRVVILSAVMATLFLSVFLGDAFTVGVRTRDNRLVPRLMRVPVLLHAGEEESSTIQGDPLRAATGIRPSLHPTTINAIAEALKIRTSNDSNNHDTPLTISDNVQPVDVALSAGKIAAAFIEKRQNASQNDGMALTPEEGQTIAGRVVGVVMRLDELEEDLYDKVSRVGWVKKYNEWSSFGVLEDTEDVPERTKTDPLFAVCRAECLLALFLHSVEAPQMRKIGQEVPGGSLVDFLDADRQEVLLDYQ